MSDVQATPAAIAVPATETVPTPAAETAPVLATSTETPAISEPVVATNEPAVVAAEAAPAAAAATEEVKPVEPVNEGLLGYKAPGLLKQFTFAKKDFWFSDEPVAASNLDLYLRGEKAEISHPVVAWASQTGKGLLFFVKRGETDKSHPAGVLPLYDATDLKKSSPHEFTFKLHGQQHSFKASTDAERDGWYHSIEKSIELGKAQKDTIRDSESYKTEHQKLGAPIAVSAAGAAAATTAATIAAAPKKSTEVDRVDGVKPAGSDDEEELKKKTKSRSTSRGLVARLRGKKEELETKVEEKKEEVEAKLEEKKEEKAAEKAAKEEEKKEETSEVATADAAVVAAEEKPKASKRGSIFGSLKAGFKSPIKEKEMKDAELKSDAAVTDAAPQIPEPVVVAPVIAEPSTVDGIWQPKAETETAKEAEAVDTPTREKKNFLSGLPFLNKRDRSVSPSAPVKEAPLATEPTVATTEPAVEAPVVAAAPETEDKVEETSTVNKRQSVLGGLGRRASKMMSRVQSSKKETPAATEAKTEETVPVVENDLAAHEATEPMIENKPETITTPATAVVATSA